MSLLTLPLPQPLPSTGDDLQQHLLGSEPLNEQINSTTGEGCLNTMGPRGQLCPVPGAACCPSSCVTLSPPLSSMPGPPGYQTPSSCTPGDKVFSHQFLRPEQLLEGKVIGPVSIWHAGWEGHVWCSLPNSCCTGEMGLSFGHAGDKWVLLKEVLLLCPNQPLQLSSQASLCLVLSPGCRSHLQLVE